MTRYEAAEDSLLQEPAELAGVLERCESGVVRIKPRLLFTACETVFPDPVALDLYLPSSGLGSISLLEAAALTALVRLSEPRVIFEFGTFLGYSTALLVRNSAPATIVHSLDLGRVEQRDGFVAAHQEAELRQDGNKNDAHLRHVQSSSGPIYLRQLKAADAARVKLHHADSRSIDVRALGLDGGVDFVFVDGGHDLATIRSDTDKALQMVGKRGVIVWHDFQSTIHGDVTTFMQEFSQRHLVIWVSNTMLAVMLVGDVLRSVLGMPAKVAARP